MTTHDNKDSNPAHKLGQLQSLKTRNIAVRGSLNHLNETQESQSKGRLSADAYAKGKPGLKNLKHSAFLQDFENLAQKHAISPQVAKQMLTGSMPITNEKQTASSTRPLNLSQSMSSKLPLGLATLNKKWSSLQSSRENSAQQSSEQSQLQQQNFPQTLD